MSLLKFAIVFFYTISAINLLWKLCSIKNSNVILIERMIMFRNTLSDNRIFKLIHFYIFIIFKLSS